MSKPISEMGWDELVPGAALYTFDGDIDYNIADIQPEHNAAPARAQCPP